MIISFGPLHVCACVNISPMSLLVMRVKVTPRATMKVFAAVRENDLGTGTTQMRANEPLIKP